jgi:glutamate carboxypeptidase
LLRREIVLLLNSDEEVGSPSRAPSPSAREECSAVYVLEPAQGLAYKTARKGTGNWRIDVTGVAAHAGVDFEKGASAIRELARVVETVSGWTDLKRGLTVSVGVAGGGIKDQRDSRPSLGRSRCPHRPQGRRPAHRAQICRPQAQTSAARSP